MNVGLTFSSTINTLALDGTTLFAGLSGLGIYRSSNAGRSWDTSSIGLYDSLPPGVLLEVTGIVGLGTTVFASSNYGIFRSTNASRLTLPTSSPWPLKKTPLLHPHHT